MNIPLLVLLYGACWRVSNLIANEPGPFQMFRRIRLYALFVCCCPEALRKLGNKLCRAFHLYDMVQCEYCNSMYVCTLACLWYVRYLHLSWQWLPVLILAGSTSVIFLKVTHEKIQR